MGKSGNRKTGKQTNRKTTQENRNMGKQETRKWGNRKTRIKVESPLYLLVFFIFVVGPF